MAGHKNKLEPTIKAMAADYGRRNKLTYAQVIAMIHADPSMIDRLVDKSVNIVDKPKVVTPPVEIPKAVEVKDVLTKESESKPDIAAAPARELTDRMSDAIESAMQALTPEKIKNQTAAGIATTLAILVDKRALLSGQATDIVQVQVSDGDAVLEALRKRAGKRTDK